MNDASPVLGADVDPGRRYLTLLFADLSGSTSMAEAMESEHYAEVLSALRALYHETISSHGGSVVRIQGDGLLAMFGHPYTREDDGRRAVEAALDLHQQVRELRLDLPSGHQPRLHTGIHSGLVLLGKGDVELGRFELLGAVPNITARLSDTAGADQILVSDETLGPASRFFVTTPPQLLQVRGRSAPILVYRVDARAPSVDSIRVGAPSGQSDFIGRQEELDTLETLLGEVLTGRTRSVAIAGPPGIGKTRLAEQFLRRAGLRGCKVLRGYCDADLGAEALQPFRQMSQTLAEPSRPGAPEMFCELFARLAATAPLLLFIDDWQWADDASNKVVTALRQAGDSPILIVKSIRTAERNAAVEAADVKLALAPLSDDEAMQAVASRLPRIDPFISLEICSHASGNPLFIEELCHSIARGDGGGRLGRLHSGAGWLNRLIESRVQHLPQNQIELVRIAAVIGNVIPIWLLQRLTGHGADSPLLQGLAEMDFVFPGELAGTLRFKHGITRDAIYDSVGLHQRQKLHLQIAEAIRQQSDNVSKGDVLEILAFHFEAGGNARQAAHHAELAGDKAHAASALDRARALYRVALAALDRLPLDEQIALRWIDIAQRLARVCVFDSSRGELALYRRAVQLAERFGDAAMIGQARHWLGYIHYGLGDAIEAITHGERALQDAERAGDDKLRARIIAALGEAHCATANYDQALPLLEQAIAVKRQHRSGRHSNVGLCFSLVCRACVLGDRGQFALAHECFDEAIDDLHGLTHEVGATTYGWRSAVLLWQGRWSEARESADRSAHIAEATRSLVQLQIARAISAYASWMIENQPVHLETIARVTTWTDPHENWLYRSLNHGWLADGFTDLGRLTEARSHAARALNRGRQRDLVGVAMAYRALAREATLNRPGAARHYIERAFDTARARGSAHEVAVTQWRAAEIALRDADGDRAKALLDSAMSAFEQMNMNWHLGEALRLRQQIN